MKFTCRMSLGRAIGTTPVYRRGVRRVPTQGEGIWDAGHLRPSPQGALGAPTASRVVLQKTEVARPL